MNFNLPEADFWPASPSVPLTHDFRFARHPAVKRCGAPEQNSETICCSGAGWVQVRSPYLNGLLPAITMFQDVMREHIAPRHKREKNDHHQHGFDIFRRPLVDLMGGP